MFAFFPIDLYVLFTPRPGLFRKSLCLHG
ncbi:Hypothetical protein HEAR1618 [Herminiimonas arsenicoxydans]|uniref:Uncharacterized protein n=1 Tax=Herminiimonas arsenicoxydans TaxID=204773 RepID=A4G5J1_HERAR|nr:Hypothetical protein HEAR1618 [Herminiimonas arsenicoxydans]